MDSPKDNSTIYVTLGANTTVECVAYYQGTIHIQLLRVVKNHSENGTDQIKVLKKPTSYVTERVDDANVLLKIKAVFHFNNVSKGDLGLYGCMAGNSVGPSTVSFILRERPRRVILPTSRTS